MHYTGQTELRQVNLPRLQFVILCHLMTATVGILEDFCPDDNLPGWQAFQRAHHLLNHVIRSGKADMTTVQCIVLNTLYILYLERSDWAYDQAGTAVRLLFQLRLHDQTLWTTIAPQEVSLRQRLFYSVYTLERNISHQLGAPFRLNDQDVNVQLPTLETSGLADRFSPLPYLCAAVRWARLLADVWSNTFRPGAPPVTVEFVAIMEARIRVLLTELPSRLRWPEQFDPSKYEDCPHYIIRQANIMHLVRRAAVTLEDPANVQ